MSIDSHNQKNRPCFSVQPIFLWRKEFQCFTILALLVIVTTEVIFDYKEGDWFLLDLHKHDINTHLVVLFHVHMSQLV